VRPTSDAPLSVQRALQDVEIRLAALESVNLTQVKRETRQALDETERSLRLRISAATLIDRNDVFRGGGAHMHGYVPDPGVGTPAGDNVLLSSGVWGPVLDGYVRVAAPGVGGRSIAQAVVEVHGSLAVLSALSACSIRTRSLDVFGNARCSPIATRYISNSALSGDLVVWDQEGVDYSGGTIVRQSGNTQVKVTEAGVYRVSCVILNEIAAGGGADLALLHYDSGIGLLEKTIFRCNNTGAGAVYMSHVVTRAYSCGAGDYFVVQDELVAGSRTFYDAAAGTNDFSIERLN